METNDTFNSSPALSDDISTIKKIIFKPSTNTGPTKISTTKLPYIPDNNKTQNRPQIQPIQANKAHKKTPDIKNSAGETSYETLYM